MSTIIHVGNRFILHVFPVKTSWTEVATSNFCNHKACYHSTEKYQNPKGKYQNLYCFIFVICFSGNKVRYWLNKKSCAFSRRMVWVLMAAKLFPRNSVKFITQICLGPFNLIIKHYNWQIERRTVSLLEVYLHLIIIVLIAHLILSDIEKWTITYV